MAGPSSSNVLKHKASLSTGNANDLIYITDDEDTDARSVELKLKTLPPLPPRRKLEDLGLSNIVQELPFHWKQWIAQERAKIELDGELTKPITLPVLDRITLGAKELKRLLIIEDPTSNKAHEGWVNDEVINGFLGLLHNQMNPGNAPPRVPRFIFQGSLFWKTIRNAFGPVRRDGKVIKSADGSFVLPKIKELPINTIRALEKNLNNNHIQRGKDIFSVEAVLFPMEVKGHWVLGVMRPRLLRVELYDSYAKVDDETSKVVPWASPAAMYWADHFVKTATSWLTWVGNNEGPHVELKAMRLEPNPGPQQWTQNDCGVYVCTTAQCLARNIEPDYDLSGPEEEQTAGPSRKKQKSGNTGKAIQKTPKKEWVSMKQREYIAAVLKQGHFGGELPWEPLGDL